MSEDNVESESSGDNLLRESNVALKSRTNNAEFAGAEAPLATASHAQYIYSQESDHSQLTGIKQHIIKLTEQLIACISSSDFKTYSDLMDPDITCFEPEGNGNLIDGLEMHRFFFDNVLAKNNSAINTCILNPYVHLIGEDAAVIAYVRYIQYLDRHQLPHVAQTEETRVWRKIDGKWKNVHFHRSANPTMPSYKLL